MNDATKTPINKTTHEDFCHEWLSEIEDGEPTSFQKGIRFATKIVTQWLGVTVDDQDFFICDGSGDGGIDIAYLQRSSQAADADNDQAEGDTWYVFQSKYGSSFSGRDAILAEGTKVISTLTGSNNQISNDTRLLVEKIGLFRKQASDADKIIFVFAANNPLSADERLALNDIKLIGRERVFDGFDVEEVSLLTIWDALDDVEAPRLSASIHGEFVEQYSGLLVGTVSLIDLFQFLTRYQRKTGNLDQLYEKNVRQFLGGRRKINRGIANTLRETPEKFGLYNNGITIVVSGYRKTNANNKVVLDDPYIVNGCQTTRTIWEVLDAKLNAGGTGTDDATTRWKSRAGRGGVVTKVVSSDEAEITNITRFTNSQNAVRERDFIALHEGFREWASKMASEYGIFLEIQRGAIESRRAWEKQHPGGEFSAYVNAFDLVKVYGAGWLGEPGLAFGKNPPFLPNGSVYERMVDRSSDSSPFGARDLYATHQVKCIADQIGFGRNASQPSRRQSRFLFYHLIVSMLRNVILLTPELGQPTIPPSALTDAVINLAGDENEDQLKVLYSAAVALVDQYLSVGALNSAHKEKSFTDIHNGDLNGFLKADNLGKENHSPLLVQLLAQHNQGFASIPMPMHEGTPTQREFVARALIDT